MICSYLNCIFKPKRKAWWYIFPVLIMSIALNIPNFMNYTLKYTYSNNSNEVNVSVIAMEQRLNREFVRDYICWATMIITAIIPILLLLFFNGHIIWKAYQTNDGLKRYLRGIIAICHYFVSVIMKLFTCGGKY